MQGPVRNQAQMRRMAGAFPCLRTRRAIDMQPTPGLTQQVMHKRPAHMEAGVSEVKMPAYTPHPLVDQDANLWLMSYEKATRDAFNAIYAALRDMASIQHELDFVARAQEIAMSRLGYLLPTAILERAWVETLDVRSLYAYCVFQTFLRVTNQQVRLDAADTMGVAAAREFFASCGFHEVDISPASDGRLKGLERFILRFPRHAIRKTKAYAGGLFDVENDLKRWQRIELRKLRQGLPSHSRYLKVAVYNRSSLRPAESGCGPFKGNELAMAEAMIARLNALRSAVRDNFPGEDLAILLLGVDTDTDALRIHVPDARGELSAYRYIDMLDAYQATRGMTADEAYDALQQRIDQVGQMQGWGKGEGVVEAGMRRFITQLMVTNISQIDYVARFHGGAYADFAHAERLMLLGENVEAFQVRNMAYYAHLYTVEESAGDVDHGVQVFRATHFTRGLPLPVVIHYRYDPQIEGSRERAIDRCQRVRDALYARYPQLAQAGRIQCFMTVRAKANDALVEWIDDGVYAGLMPQGLQ